MMRVAILALLLTACAPPLTTVTLPGDRALAVSSRAASVSVESPDGYRLTVDREASGPSIWEQVLALPLAKVAGSDVSLE